MSEQNINNIFNISGHHNNITFSQSNEYSDNRGADAAQILQIVLGFVAMIVLSPIWLPIMLAQASYKALNPNNDHYSNLTG